MSILAQKIYPFLPVFTQNWAISAYGYNWHMRRFGGIYQQEVRNFKEREGYSSQQWHDYQTVQLRKILVHAIENIPFYRERYLSKGWTKSQFERFELANLSKLPILSKDDLRSFGRTTLVSTSTKEKGGQFFSSSGSTGTPTQILYSKSFHQRVNAFMEARVRNWAGIYGAEPRGMIGGRRIIQNANSTPPFYRYNFFERQTYFSAYHISLKNAPNYLDGLKKNKVAYMTGYAMSNYLLASSFEQINLEAPSLKAVITSSEKLTPRMRELFKKVYDCKTFDSYSGVENCGLISETPEGQLLISPDVGIMEILDEFGNPVIEGKEGEVISTGFLNMDQPLIRYRIGDIVSLASDQSSNCGRSMPIVSEITGRTEDCIQTSDGRRMVRFHGIFINLPSVIEGQVIQHSYENYSVNITATRVLPLEEKQIIESRMKSQLGNDIKVTIHQLDTIPRTANGKFKAVISELK